MSERDFSIDILKGLAIILVIVGHSKISYNLDHFIFSFHMPLFFFVSGFFYKNRSLKEEFSLSCKRLLLPYAFTSLLLMLIALGKSATQNNIVIFTDQAITCLLGGVPFIKIPVYEKVIELGPLWFLLALFWNRIFASILFCRIKKNMVHFLIALTIAFIGITFSRRNIFLPWYISSALCSYAFFLTGHFIHALKDSHFITKYAKILFGFSICCWIYCIWKSGLAMNASIFGAHYIVDLIGALGGTMFFYLLTKKLLNPNLFVGKTLSFAGQFSLLIFCIHSLECNNISWNTLLDFLPAYQITYPITVIVLRLSIAFLGTFLILKSEFLKKKIFGIH